MITYRNAEPDDMMLLVEARLDFINVFKTDDNYELLKANVENYFVKGFQENQFDIILAEDENKVIGTGIIFYYDAVPSSFNPWGKNAYITSMLVQEDYRKQGIATAILDRLVQGGKLKGYHLFILQESDLGRPVYKKYGFQEGKKGMILKI